MRYLAIDYGSAYLGLAMGDDASKLAGPFDTISEPDLEKQLKNVVQIVLDENIDAIVVGMPLNLEGNTTAQSGETISFISELEGRVSVPVYREDERLTTKLAQVHQKEAAGGFDDHALAATAILQTFLDKQA